MEKKTSVTGWLSTFLFCMVFWLLLTWSVQPIELIEGAVVSAIVACFAARFLIHTKAFRLWNPVRLVLLVVYLLAVFLWELIKANVAMAKIVWSPKLDYHPGIIRVKGEHMGSDYGYAMLSDCITLTPGTITLDVAEDENHDIWYYIHWINAETTDRTQAGALIKGRMERWIGRIWK